VAVLKHSDPEARALLLASARELIADQPDFTLKTLFSASGVSRAQFRRCFADKAQLLAALTQSEVKALEQILDVAQPAAIEQNLRVAVGGNIAPPVQNDAWLERRLRVFERALTGLEKQQEKSEQGLSQRLAMIEEKLAVQAAAQQTTASALPLPASARSASVPASVPVSAPQPEPQQQPEAEIAADGETEAAAVTIALVEEIAAPAPAHPPISEKEKEDFLAHARLVAQNAAFAQALPPPPRHTRLLAWGGVVLTFVLLCAGLLFASGLGGHAAGAMAMTGISHRHVAQTGLARVVALADSGDANAETELALAYLRGAGVTADAAAAQRWSGAAAAQGEPVAQYLLGTFYLQRDQSEAVRWFRSAAEQGNLKAMHNLAIAYAQGLGVAPDPVTAVRWFTRAAEQGYRDSQFDLAVLYERGMGVPQSGVAALKWYLIAAAQGDAPSATRAVLLRGQTDPADVQAATQAAAAFVPQAAKGAANQLPAI
jgi:TPR repeat protein